MKPFSMLLLLGLILTGCASTNPDESNIGSYVSDLSPALARQIAADSVRQIESSHPAASTRLQVRQPATDTYGVALRDTLRLHGYAVQERSRQPNAAEASPSKATPAGQTEVQTVPLAYLIDLVPQPKLYRVTLYLGERTITRGYIAQGDKLRPASAWVRRE